MSENKLKLYICEIRKKAVMKKIVFILMCTLTTTSFASLPENPRTEIQQKHFTFGKVNKEQSKKAVKKLQYIEFTTSCGIPVWAEYDTDYYSESDVIDIMIYVDEYFCAD